MASADELGIEGIDEIEALDIDGSAIFRGRQFRHNRTVAIKILDPHQEPLVPKRFDLRRKQIQKFAEDEGVVKLYQSGVNPDGEQYLIMPFFRIGSLADQLDHGPMPWHRAAELVMRTSEIVARAHDLGVVLGDLKPSSVMLADASSPLISFYGMATRRFDDGTPTYQAPETTRGGSPTPAADVYSLTLTLASLIAGRPPNRGPMSDAFLAEVSALAPARIVEVIEQGLSTNVGKRYISATQLASALAAAIRGDEPSFGSTVVVVDESDEEPFDLDELLGLSPPPPAGPANLLSSPEDPGLVDNYDNTAQLGLESMLELPTATDFEHPTPAPPQPLDNGLDISDVSDHAEPVLHEGVEEQVEDESPDVIDLRSVDETEPASPEADLSIVEEDSPDTEPGSDDEVNGSNGHGNGHNPELIDLTDVGSGNGNGSDPAVERTPAAPVEYAESAQTTSQPSIERIAAATGELVLAPSAESIEPPLAEEMEPPLAEDATQQIVLDDATQQMDLPSVAAAEFVPPPPQAHDAIANLAPDDLVEAADDSDTEVVDEDWVAPSVAPNEAEADLPPPPQAEDAIPADLSGQVLDEPTEEAPAWVTPMADPVIDETPPPPAYVEPEPEPEPTAAPIDETPPPPAYVEPEPEPQLTAASAEVMAAPFGSQEDPDAQRPILGAGSANLADEELPFRAFDRQHQGTAAPSAYLRFLDPIQVAWIQIRRSLGALLALIGFAVIAGVVGMVVLRGPQTATSGPNSTFSPVQEEGSPSTFLPTSEAPVFVEPPPTHQTTTTRRVIRTTPSTAAPTTAAPTTAAPTTGAPTTRPATTRPATTRPATTAAPTTRPATTQSTRPPSSPTTLSPTLTSRLTTTAAPTTRRSATTRRTTTTADDDDDALQGPTLPLIRDASVSRIRATTAQVQFSSSSCVTATFSYAVDGGSATSVSGGARCSRSYNLLLGTVTPRLSPGTTYTVTITATDTEGATASQRLSFTTLG